MKFGYPTAFFTSVDITAGSSAQPDSGALQHPFRLPMVIDEISMTTKIAPSFTGSPGGSIQTKFKMNTLDLMSDPIPLWSFNPTTDTFRESSVGSAFESVDQYVFTNFLWKLPKPLYVPSGGALVPVVNRISDNGGSARVDFAYHGRTVLDPVAPNKIAVPFIGVFIQPYTAAAGQSNARNLYNPFQVPLHVQRLVLRAYINNSVERTSYTTSDGYTIKLTNSNGVMFTRDFVPYSAAVNRSAGGTAVLGITIPPKQWITTEIVGTTTGTNIDVTAIGWREENP